MSSNTPKQTPVLEIVLIFRHVFILPIIFFVNGCSTYQEVRFAAMGDTPYYESETELENVSMALNQMADKGVPFVVHVGDIIRSGTECSQALYQLRANIFSNSPIPFIITIGDNEFNDCRDPELARTHFINVILGNPPPIQWVSGKHNDVDPIKLTRQKAMIENAFWQMNGVTFILLAFPDLPGNFPLSQTQMGDIVRSNTDFLKATMQKAINNKHHAVVLIMHANPVNCLLPACTQFAESIKEEVTRFLKPVLLLNGSNHKSSFEKSGYLDIPNLSHLRPGNEPEVKWPEVIFSTQDNTFSVKWHYANYE